MAAVPVSNSEKGVATLHVSNIEGDVAIVSVSNSKGGVTYVSISESKVPFLFIPRKEGLACVSTHIQHNNGRSMRSAKFFQKNFVK